MNAKETNALLADLIFGTDGVRQKIDAEQAVEQKVKIGDCVSFTIEKSPTRLMRSGTRHAGTVVLIRGERVTVLDSNGFRYTVRASSCRA
jgi:hypothetical protein